MTGAEHMTAPEGFTELPEGLGFTDALRPVYRREFGESIQVGMHVQEAHTNMIGICHGGVLMTLADVGAAWSLHYLRDKVGGAPTLNLSFDFIAAARQGDWIQVEPDRVELKKRFGFSSGVIVNQDQRVITRFNGMFYFPDPGQFEPKSELLHQAIAGSNKD